MGFASIACAELPGFHHEVGGHRIQRVPEGEKRGRVQTSAVTVSVMGDERAPDAASIADSDLRIRWFSGTGKGGQHRNRHQNSVELTHLPTGVSRSAQTRSRENSMAEAREALERAVAAVATREGAAHRNGVRREQIGSGMRADARRSWRFQDDRVVDDVTGMSTSCSRAMRGHLDELWR